MDDLQKTKLNLTMDAAIERLGMGRFQYQLMFTAGLNTLSDTMEIILLTFLTFLVQVEWDLSDHEAALLTSSVFIGAIVGTLTLGPLGDDFGRKPLFVGCGLIIATCGVASAFAPSYLILLICRFGVGLGVGGAVVPFDALAEFIPQKHRGKMLLSLGYLWTLGLMAVPALAFFAIKEEDSWRLLVLLVTIPVILGSVLALVWVPESPRWLATQGRAEEGLIILRLAAITNGLDPIETFPLGTQIVGDDSEGHSDGISISRLLQPKYRRMNLLLWGTWAGLAFLYWGLIQIVTLIFVEFDPEKLAKGQTYDFDYSAIFWSSVAELVGLTIAILSIDHIGRVRIVQVGFFVGGLCTSALCFKAYGRDEDDRAGLLTLSFLARMLLNGAMCTTWIITAEILPTEIRSSGHSVSNAVSRTAGAATPFLVTKSMSMHTIGIAMAVIGALTLCVTCMLPETKGTQLGTAGINLHLGSEIESLNKSAVGEILPESTRKTKSADI